MSVSKVPIAALIAVLGMIAATLAFSASASAYPPGTGPSLSLSSSTAPEGGSVTVFGNGFTPGTVNLTLCSTTSSLGTAQADSTGAFTQGVTLPAGVTGAQKICGTNSAGTASADITITTSSGGGGGGGGGTGGGGGNLAGTGAAVIGIGVLGVLLLVGGGAMLLAGKRRKATG